MTLKVGIQAFLLDMFSFKGIVWWTSNNNFRLLVVPLN